MTNQSASGGGAVVVLVAIVPLVGSVAWRRHALDVMMGAHTSRMNASWQSCSEISEDDVDLSVLVLQWPAVQISKRLGLKASSSALLSAVGVL